MAFPVGSEIGPGEYLVVWADEANILLHTNFSLAAEGGEIGLFDAAGNPIDSIIYSAQKTDFTFGLLDDAPGVWRYLDVPSPGIANSNTGFIGFTEPVAFSLPGGFYSTSQSVELSTAGLGTIHYTTDGSVPNEESPVYSGPLSVGTPIVLRAAAFQPEFLSSDVTTETYLVNEQTDLPVFSITMDPDDLFSDDAGIYVEGTNGVPGNCSVEPRNWNQDWEKVANVEFFDLDGVSVFNQLAGVKISGGCSREFDQKSLALIARLEYGKESFDYPFFPDKEITSFESIELRNSGQDWFRTMFRDGLIHTVLQAHPGMHVMAYRPAIVYLNGAYWGIHNMRELPNLEYFESNFGVQADNLDFLLGQAFPVAGSADAYNEMIEFIGNNDLALAQNMAAVEALMDIDQFMDYQVAEIYSANADWPSSNIRYWRSPTLDNKWRWVVYDMDLAFGGNENGAFDSNTLFQATDPAGPDWPNPPWSTELLRELLDNEDFKHRFVQRIASHANITFDSTYVNQVIDSLAATIASEVERHKERWDESIGFNTPWETHIESMREFPRNRPAFLRTHVASEFGFNESATLEVTISGDGEGRVFVSGVPLRSNTFQGIYFSGIPLELRAEPAEGYMFAGWEGDVVSEDNALTLMLSASTTVEAVFEEMVDTTPNEEVESPFAFSIGANFPNPFSVNTTIPFELGRPGLLQFA